MDNKHIRNFCIIAHIDHGKSTLADRFLELTHTVPDNKMRSQYLDQMDLERERGITIKLQPVRMSWKGYELNLIDTPGHVDFGYEVSRSLACVEGALLLVDATQGIEAQTLSNLYLARQQHLTIIPVINKIDMPDARVEETSLALADLLGVEEDTIIKISAKTGQNVDILLDAAITLIAPPRMTAEAASDLHPSIHTATKKALIFDSQFDDYRGVIVYIRVFEGEFTNADDVLFTGTGATSQILESGYFHPERTPASPLTPGQIGYLVTTLRDSALCRVGDTITDPTNPSQPLPGYQEMKPMVYAGLFINQDDFAKLRTGLEKLKLSDPSLTYEAEHSPSLGYGFRVGFLGLLHLEIITERLRREYNLEPIITPPSVSYRVTLTKTEEGEPLTVRTPIHMPSPEKIARIEEPWLKVEILTPPHYIGNVMSLLGDTRAEHLDTAYLSDGRALLHYHMPLSLLLKGLYDKLKGVSAGYASLNYDFLGWKETQVSKLDIRIAGENAEELSQLVYPEDAQKIGRGVVEILKKEIPPVQFEIKLQAAVGGQILASETIRALRKDVTAKLYGGDVTRKMKLLKKQKEGKKKMRSLGKVEIPSHAYLSVYKNA